MIRLNGYNDCILGVAYKIGCEDIIAYDKNKILEKLQLTDEMDEEEAEDFFQYNILGSFAGDTTPVFIGVNDHEQF